MNLQHLLQARPGSSQIVVAAPTELETALRSPDRGPDEVVEVRFLRGKKMRTKAGLLDEFAAALQFPHCFGENWDALRDVLSSLPLLKTGALLICVWDAPEVLRESTPEDSETLGRVVEQVRADLGRKRSANALRWGWQVPAEKETEFRDKWSKLGLI